MAFLGCARGTALVRTEPVLVNFFFTGLALALRSLRSRASIKALVVVPHNPVANCDVLLVDGVLNGGSVRTVAVAAGGLSPLALLLVNLQKRLVHIYALSFLLADRHTINLI